jgi:hypothetical protein|tara:strand:+ start:3403 stop:3603 length:201 start_codon:yes stop_codon:yes gene_type:complete
MSHVIKIKRSETAGSVPQASDLQTHELAMNVSDKTIYTKNSSGQIVTMSSAGITESEALALSIALG